MGLPIKELLNIGKVQLERAGVMDAAIDAKTLYCFMKMLTKEQFILRWQYEADDDDCEKYFRLIEKRASGVPTQHITGEQEFMGHRFMVNEKVLIPRQDTETMVEDALSLIDTGKIRGEEVVNDKKSWDILDLCCGSGAIGVSLSLDAKKKVKVSLADINKDALSMARKNGEALQTKEIKYFQGNMFEPFEGKFSKKKFDLIISNPPYIRSDVIPTLQREVKDHEPMLALDGGTDGLDFYRTIAEKAPNHLNKEGILMVEIGYDQGEAVKKLFEETGKMEDIVVLEDLTHKDRIVVGKLAQISKKK